MLWLAEETSHILVVEDFRPNPSHYFFLPHCTSAHNKIRQAYKSNFSVLTDYAKLQKGSGRTMPTPLPTPTAAPTARLTHGPWGMPSFDPGAASSSTAAYTDATTHANTETHANTKSHAESDANTKTGDIRWGHVTSVRFISSANEVKEISKFVIDTKDES